MIGEVCEDCCDWATFEGLIPVLTRYDYCYLSAPIWERRRYWSQVKLQLEMGQGIGRLIVTAGVLARVGATKLHMLGKASEKGRNKQN